jgi:multidrug efflux system membrane fusion protein
MHLNSLRFAAVVLPIVMAAGGCSPPVAVPPDPPKVSVAHPEKRELADQETFNGWLDASQTLEVRSRVRGHIHKVHFTDGQMVEKNDALFDLDPQPFQTEIARAAEKQKIYEAQKVAAEKEEERLKGLLKIGGASKQQTEKAEADVKSLDAQISAAKEEVKRAKLDLDYSHIKADISGRVSQARLTEGNLVNAGGSDPLLTTIVSIDPIRVYFNVDERSLLRYTKNLQGDAKKVRIAAKTITEALTLMKDMEANFTFALDGEKEFTHPGKLFFGDNRIDPTTGTMVLYGTLDNAGGKFLPGARVRVRIPIGNPYSALLVPEIAILADQDKRYVLIVDENPQNTERKSNPEAKNAVRRRNVTLGTLTDDGMRAIQPADKLAQGESPENWWVIVDNLQRARINYPVDPQKPEAKAKEQ